MKQRRKFKSVIDLINLFNIIHNNKYKYSFDKFKKVKDKIKIICPEHGEFYQSIHKHLEGQGCTRCKYIKIANQKRIPQEEIIKKFIEVHGNKFDYSKTIITRINDTFEAKCNNCGFIFRSYPYIHLKGHGCRKCGYKTRSIKRTSNLFEFEQKARNIHGDKYTYYEYKKNNEKVKITCNKCQKDFNQKPTDHLSGKGCPYCNFSKGEELIDFILTKNNVRFERQFKLPHYKFRFDFYLPDHNLLIEYHGKQHYEPVSVFGGDEGFVEVLQRDALKRNLAYEYRIKLLELNYKEFRITESSFEKLLMTYINNCKPFNERRNFGSSV